MLNRRSKISATLTLFAVAAISVLASVTAPDGYEHSIYFFLNYEGWAIILVVLGILAVRLAYSVFYSDDAQEIGMQISCVGVLNVLILSLPGLRGYFMYGRADVATINGRINRIILNAQIPHMNTYPGFHLDVVSLQFILNKSVSELLFFYPILLYCLSILFLYLLAREVLETPTETFIAAGLGTAMLFSYRSATIMFDMQAMSLYVLPLLIYPLYRFSEFGKQGRVLTAILWAGLIIYHPVILILFVGMLTISIVWREFTSYSPKWDIRLSVVIALIIAAYLWFTSSIFFYRSIHRVGFALLGRISKTAIGRNLESIRQFDVGTFAIEFLKILGHDVLYLAVGTVGGIIMLLVWRAKFEDFIPLTVWTFVSTFAQLGHMVGGVFALFIYRFVGPMVTLTPLFGAVSLEWVRQRSQLIAAAVFALLLTSGVVVGMASVHPSPYRGDHNSQIHPSEIEAADWAFDYSTEDTNYRGIVTRPFRFADLTMGVTARVANGNIVRREFLAAKHLGYSNGTTSTTISSDTLIFIADADLLTLGFTAGRASQYTWDDYQRLKTDSTVMKVYESESIRYYYIDS